MESNVVRTWYQSVSVEYWSTDQSWQQVQSAWVQISTAQWFLKTCSVAKQRSEYFDDRCIILIQFFGGYWVSEVLNSKVACARNTREVLHERTTLDKCFMQELHVRMQEHSKCTGLGHINSFLVERECWILQQKIVNFASRNNMKIPTLVWDHRSCNDGS